MNTFGRNFLAFANPEAGFPDKEAIGLAGTAGLQKKRILSSVFYAAGTNAKKGKISYVNHLKAWLNNNEDSDEAEPNHGEEQVVYNGEENDHAKSIEAKKDQLTPENISEIKETGCLDEEKKPQNLSNSMSQSQLNYNPFFGNPMAAQMMGNNMMFQMMNNMKSPFFA